MNIVANCPICGEVPAEVDHGWNATQSYYECCDVQAGENVWNHYVAAMNLAKATVALENAMEPLNSGKLKMGAALPAIKLAMTDQKACEQRVLEVFEDDDA